MSNAFLVLPPNILRRSEDIITKKFPEIELRAHHTHAEMDEHFSHQFGKAEFTADLTISAYPQALYSAADSDLFADMPSDLPPLRPELAELGLGEAPAYVKVIGVVPVVMIHNTEVADPPNSWEDLSNKRWWGNVVSPPHDTPLPALFRYYMESNFGSDGASAADALHPELYPLDINKYVDEGRFQVGLVIPAFGRNFRLGSGTMVWPAEGAVAVPMMAFLRKDAAPPVRQLLEYLLSLEFQEFMSNDGLICPAVQEAPLFQELLENQSRFIWSGWDAAADIGDHLAKAQA
jgi:ABC-type Fe3+ transport system substrate-binding protein